MNIHPGRVVADGSKRLTFGLRDGETPDVPKCEECGDLTYCANSSCKRCHPSTKGSHGHTDFGYLVEQGPSAFMANPPLKFRVGEPWFYYPMIFTRIDNTDNYFCYQVTREGPGLIKQYGYLYHWKTKETLTPIINEENGRDENAMWTWTEDMPSIGDALMELRIKFRTKFEESD
jgi:hypothetical protein